jgi:hypothetical protein
MTAKILTQQAVRAERFARFTLDEMAFEGLMALAKEYRAKAEALSARTAGPSTGPIQPVWCLEFNTPCA